MKIQIQVIQSALPVVEKLLDATAHFQKLLHIVLSLLFLLDSLIPRAPVILLILASIAGLIVCFSLFLSVTVT